MKSPARIFAVCAVLALLAAPLLANATSEQMPPPPAPATTEAPVQVAPPVPTPMPEPAPAPTPKAENALGDLVPPQSGQPAELAGALPAAEFPIMRMTPDKIEVVRLEKDATNVIVGNSTHLLGMLETPRQIILVPRQPGATHFQVLDARGDTLMERSVIIASPKQDYVRVRRTCATVDGGKDCTEYSIYYCPDMCHEIAVTQPSKSGGGSGGAVMPDQTASSPQSPGNAMEDGSDMVGATAEGAGNTAGTIGAATGVQ